MLLDAFSSMTGLHINFDKSTFVPVNVQEEATNLMAAILSYPVAAFPQTYLGLPLSIHELRFNDLHPLPKVLTSYISGWCGKPLTPSGRTVLVNAVVLNARPVYAKSPILLLQSTIQAINATRHTFLWMGDSTCTGGQCKVAWTAVCLEKATDGLGVKDLTLQNQALLLKFVNKLLQPPTMSWQHWFHRLYGEGANHDLGTPHRLDTPVWSALLHLLPFLQ
jgi:hypothetical protein